MGLVPEEEEAGNEPGLRKFLGRSQVSEKFQGRSLVSIAISG